VIGNRFRVGAALGQNNLSNRFATGGPARIGRFGGGFDNRFGGGGSRFGGGGSRFGACGLGGSRFGGGFGGRFRRG